MAYTKTTWVDRNVSTPLNYVATKGGGGALSSGDTLTMTASPGTVTASGTSITASNMNNIENALESAYNESRKLYSSGTTVSSPSVVSITVPNTSKRIEIELEDLSNTTPTSYDLLLTCNTDTTSNYSYNFIDNSVNNSNSSTSIQTTLSLQGNSRASIVIHNQNANNVKTISFVTSSPTTQNTFGTGVWKNVVDKISTLDVKFDAGTVATGLKYEVWYYE